MIILECYELYLQIFKPSDLLDDKGDFSAVLVTIQELYRIAAGTVRQFKLYFSSAIPTVEYVLIAFTIHHLRTFYCLMQYIRTLYSRYLSYALYCTIIFLPSYPFACLCAYCIYVRRLSIESSPLFLFSHLHRNGSRNKIHSPSIQKVEKLHSQCSE